MEALTPALLHQNASVVISDESGVGEARRVASALCDAAGFDATRRGKLALVVTEAASNVIYHAKGGEILLRRVFEDGREGVEMLAIDRGPGMRNIAQSSVDGYSTRGTAGTGLGSIARNSNEFDIFSAPDRGTVLLARVWNGAEPGKPGPTRWGAVCVAMSGEEVCGDGWASKSDGARTKIVLLDGLGHGQGAADATLAALRSFNANPSLGPNDILAPLHEALRPTRGAAAAVVSLDAGTQQLRFVGVGNCSASIHPGPGARQTGLASQNGTLGVRLPKTNELSYAWPADCLLIMHTDGLSTRWNLDDYPGLFRRHPTVIAGLLYRDFSRNRDDVTVLAFTSRSA
ncbi:MAG TPA: ATP-binding SpoIIE family protein phosphatase [Polyangiales bacterium]|nr:ATP-binding SpoIIE family protein phosphatase [Polyangiales bacterium]